MVQRFSPVALTAAAALSLSGLTAAVVYLGTLGNLFRTGYGQVLVLKLLVIGGLALCGWFNWKRTRSGQSFSLQLMTIELTLAGIVVLVTSVLTELEHP
jgi:putative copper export protein